MSSPPPAANLLGKPSQQQQSEKSQQSQQPQQPQPSQPQQIPQPQQPNILYNMSSPPAAANLLGQPSQSQQPQVSLSSDLLGGGDFQRPVSDILVMANGQAVHSNLSSQAGRPASEIINKNFKSPEAEAIDRLFEDLSYYERTLEEMAQAKLDDNFLEELTAIEQWFNCLSNCEKTTALYSLLQQATPVQVRFFITVLQQKAQKETPGNVVDKSHERDHLYPPKSPGMKNNKFHPRHSAPIDEGQFKKMNEDNIYHHPHHNEENRGYMGNRRNSTHSLKGKDEKQKLGFEMGMSSNQSWTMGNYSNNQNNLSERTSSLQQQQHQHHNNHKNGNHINPKRSFNKINSPKSPAFPKPLSPLITKNNVNDKNGPPVSPGGSNKWNSNSSNRGYAHSEYSDADDDANSRRGSQYHRAGSTAGSTTAGSVSGKDKGKIPDKIELELLEDIPTWLRSLRLHKYTHIFESMSWKEMVVLTDEELTQKGVAALGARRKLLKVFAMVQEEAKKQNIELPKGKGKSTDDSPEEGKFSENSSP